MATYGDISVQDSSYALLNDKVTLYTQFFGFCFLLGEVINIKIIFDPLKILKDKFLKDLQPLC